MTETKFRDQEEKQRYIQELEQELEKQQRPSEHAERLYENRWKPILNDFKRLKKQNFTDINLNFPDQIRSLEILEHPSINFETTDFADQLSLAKALLEKDKQDLDTELWGKNAYLVIRKELKTKALEKYSDLRKEWLSILESERKDIANKISEEIQSKIAELEHGEDREAERFRNYLDAYPLWRESSFSPSEKELWRLIRWVKERKINHPTPCRNNLLNPENLEGKPWQTTHGTVVESYVEEDLFNNAASLVNSIQTLRDKNQEIRSEISRYF